MCKTKTLGGKKEEKKIGKHKLFLPILLAHDLPLLPKKNHAASQHGLRDTATSESSRGSRALAAPLLQPEAGHLRAAAGARSQPPAPPAAPVSQGQVPASHRNFFLPRPAPASQTKRHQNKSSPVIPGGGTHLAASPHHLRNLPHRQQPASPLGNK